jgi:hypothetical protein
MDNTFKHIYTIASILLAFVILWRFTEKTEHPGNFVQTDTVHVKEIKTIQPIQNNYPTKLVIQKTVDTVYRERVEKEIIITGVKIDGNTVTIQKVSPTGEKTEEVHKIEEGSKVEIDNQNFEEKKRTKVGKLLRKVGKVSVKGLAVIGGVVIVYTAIK